MIIGVSGKIGSGKDTIAKIIQYYTYCKTGYAGAVGSVEDCILYLNGKYDDKNDLIAQLSTWRVKKFASKLKKIVSLLTGYTLDELESQEIKNSLLSDDWQVFEIYNYGRLHKVKDREVEAEVFCKIHSNSQHKFTYKKSERTVRWMLQYIGTDLFRDKLHANCHVNALFSDYNEGALTTNRRGPHDNWLITDVRFTNEAEAILRREGLLIRTSRLTPRVSTHESETALDDFEDFHYYIDNNGTIEELIEKVKEILQNEKII